MVDLAVTAHQHPQVAFTQRSNGSGNTVEAPFAFSLEQLLQDGMMLRYPPAADLLQAERESADRGNGAAEEIAGQSRRRFQTRRSETIDYRQDADAAPPVPQETDDRRRASADSDGAEHCGKRADRREAHPLVEPADAVAASQPSDTGMSVNAVPQPPRHAAQGAAAPVPVAVSQPPLAGAADADEPAMTAPASRQLAASVSRDVDVLVSHSSSALAPTAALAAEHFQGPGHRLRSASPGAPYGAMSASTSPAPGGSEGPVQPVAETVARLEANARPNGAQAASGSVIAGASDTGATAAGAGAQVIQGQNAAMTAAAGTAASPVDKTLITSSAATTSDARSSAGIATGPAVGGIQTVQQATGKSGPEGLARTEPFQQRIIGDQVSVHIKKAVQEGMDRIEIRLKPEALGRVDVRLELGPEGRVVATVTADQRHTLELLRSDARSLERALQEAGLQTDGGSLNFNLRSGGDGKPGQHDEHPAAAPLPTGHGTDGGGGQAAPPPGFNQAVGHSDGIDIHA